MASQMSRRIGLRGEIPWILATQIVLFIYFILTCFSMFYRADFLSLTCCAVGLLVLDNPDLITRATFRRLALCIVLSWIYDIVFLLFIRDGNAEAEADGGTESTVRAISLLFCYISFFFRIIVALVFWKDSLDFKKIIRGSKGQGQKGFANKGLTPEQQ